MIVGIHIRVVVERRHQAPCRILPSSTIDVSDP